MTTESALSPSQLYDCDLALWYADILTRLKSGDLQDLDVEHLIGEIEGLAARE